MDAIAIEPFVLDQMRIRYYRRHVGYCGNKPNMPVSFLFDCGLTDEQKTECIQAVLDLHGTAKQTPQTKDLWPDERQRTGADT